MPCDTPPPPTPVEDAGIGNDEDPDDSMYEVIDMDELDEILVDDALTTFSCHSDVVFCCNFDRTGQYVISGGQDDKAFVCSVINKDVKFECTGHTDSVISVNFSPDSKYACTADMNGGIQVWDVNDGSVVWNFNASEILWTEWLHGANVLLAGDADGCCWMWDIPDGGMCPEIFHHSSGCSVGCISFKDDRLVTGYQDGTLKLWDLSSHKLLNKIERVGNTTVAKFSADDSLILTGSEDGTAKLIKAIDFKIVWNITDCDSSHSSASVESVGFCHGHSYIVTGTNCGSLCIWDMHAKSIRSTIELGSAVVKLICDESAPILYAAIADGTLQAYDTRTGHLVKKWEGHKAAIFDFAISSDQSLLLTASEDHTCKIFERGTF